MPDRANNVVKLKIIHEDVTGRITKGEMNMAIPDWVFQDVSCFLIDWKALCGASVSDVEEFQKNLKSFEEKESQNNP